MKQHTPLHLRLSQPLQHFHLHQKRASPPTQWKNDRRMERREPFSSERALKPFFRRSSKGRSQTSASQNLRFNETSTKSNTVHCTCVHHVSSVMTFGDSPEPALQFSSSSARSSKKHSIVASCQDVPKWLKNVSAGPLSDDNLALNHHLHKACFGTQHLVAAEWTSSLLTHIKYYYYTTLFRLQLSHCCASMSFLIFLFISHSKVSHPISCFFRNLYNSIVYNLQHIPFRLSLASHSRVRRASKYAFRLNKNRWNWIFCLFKRLALRQWTFHRLKAAHLRIPSKYLKHCPRSVGLQREYPTKMSPANNYHNRECLRHQHIFWSFHRHWRASGKSPCLAWKFQKKKNNQNFTTTNRFL